MNIIKNQRLGIHLALIGLWHPKNGYYSGMEEKWLKPSLFGASKRRERGVLDVTRWHLRHPVWYSRKKQCFLVATWSFVRVHRRLHPDSEMYKVSHEQWKVWELGRGTQ